MFRDGLMFVTLGQWTGERQWELQDTEMQESVLALVIRLADSKKCAKADRDAR
jgi:hypothetical protein